MNKLVLSALAATVAMGTTYASEGEWAGLDAELNTLTTALDNHGGPSVSGYLEAGYNSDSEAWQSGSRANVALTGSNYHVDISGSEDTDAYVTFEMAGMNWQMGTFMAPGTGADAEAENDRVFSTRNFGDSGDRSNGLMTGGDMSGIGWQVFIGDDTTLAARVTYDVMSGDGMNLSVAYSMDDSDDSTAIEANVSSGPFSVNYTMQDDDGVDDTCLTAGYAVNDTWGVAIRQTDNADTMDWAVTYGEGGTRWTIETLDDGDLTVGLLVNF